MGVYTWVKIGCKYPLQTGQYWVQINKQHYPVFREMRAIAGRSLPDCIEYEFDAYLKCGRLEEGFLRVRCEHCHAE